MIEQKKRVTSIDGFRGILALIIALFHFGQSYPIGPFFHRGYFAVEVFFMISGFLFIQSLDSKKKNFCPSALFISKLCRLYPGYLFSIVALIMLYSVAWFYGNPVAWIVSDAGHRVSFIAEILGIQVTGVADLIYINGPVWYVSALLCTSAVLILLYWITSEKFFDILTALAALVIYVALYVYNPAMDSAGFLDSNKLVSIPLLRGIAGMCFGIVLYRLNRGIEKRWVWTTKVYSILAKGSLLVLIGAMIITEPSRTNFLLFIPAGVAIICLFSIKDPEYFPILNSSVAQYMGKISYTFFVMQSFWQNFATIYISKMVNSAGILTFAYIFLNICCSSLLYPILELRIPRILRHGNRRYHDYTKKEKLERM